MTSPFAHINTRTIRRDRRRSIGQGALQVLPWVCAALVVLQLAHMGLSAAVAFHSLTERAEALKGM